MPLLPLIDAVLIQVGPSGFGLQRDGAALVRLMQQHCCSCSNGGGSGAAAVADS